MSERYKSFKYPLVVEGGPVSAQNARALEQHLRRDPWHVPTLKNSWVDYAPTSWQGARYRKTLDGTVYIEGLVKDGTTTPGTPIFTLPEGYRPNLTLMFATLTSPDVIARLTIQPNGDVNTGTGCVATYYSITCSFAT